MLKLNGALTITPGAHLGATLKLTPGFLLRDTTEDKSATPSLSLERGKGGEFRVPPPSLWGRDRGERFNTIEPRRRRHRRN